ncbi:MAG TPA: MFS transporter [Casimicrobiaceae bacterium]|nr:MFS transporter [Casimicrobiaceae bacterium]
MAFVVAACSLVFVFATAGVPIPLYNLYRAQDGITNADLGMVSVGYFVAAAISLLTFGRLSNHLGRRPIAIAALMSALLSSIILMSMRGVAPLFAARLLQGFACGIASSGLGAYVVDAAPTRPKWLPAVITGSAPMLGIPIGALACGALAEYGPAPRSLIYEITASALAICAWLIFMSPETVRRNAGALRSLRPHVEIPAGRESLLISAGAALVATWSLGGFYQAFGPSVVAEYLGAPSAFMAAAVFSSFMLLSPAGGPLIGRLSASVALRLGMIGFILALAGVVASMRAGAVIPFIAATLLAGLANGAASTGAMGGLLARATPEQRAGLLSTIYLISYTGAALPGIVAGRLAATWTLFHIALGYATLGLVGAVIAIFALRVGAYRTR